MISELQIKWPTKRTLIGKTDLDAAYRQVDTNVTTTLTCNSIVYELAFLCQILPFGATPVPEEYINVIEAEIDLVNNLLRDESCYTDDLNLLHPSLTIINLDPYIII